MTIEKKTFRSAKEGSAICRPDDMQYLTKISGTSAVNAEGITVAVDKDEQVLVWTGREDPEYDWASSYEEPGLRDQDDDDFHEEDDDEGNRDHDDPSMAIDPLAYFTHRKVVTLSADHLYYGGDCDDFSNLDVLCAVTVNRDNNDLSIDLRYQGFFLDLEDSLVSTRVKSIIRAVHAAGIDTLIFSEEGDIHEDIPTD